MASIEARTYEVNSGDTPLGLSFAGNCSYYISLSFATMKAPKISVKTLDTSSGKQTGLITLSIDREIVSAESFLYFGAASPLLIWTDNALKVLNINVIGIEHISSFNILRRNDEQVERVFIHAPLAKGTQIHFLVHYQSEKSHWAEVYHVDLSFQSTVKAYELPLSSGFGAFSASIEGATVFFTRVTETEIKLFSSLHKDELAHWPIRNENHHGSAHPKVVSHAVSEVVFKGASKYAVRCALVLPTGDWELVRNGDYVWLRPESLAGVIAAAFIEPFQERGLADELAIESHSSLSTAYVHRVKRHLKALKYLPAWTQSWASGLKKRNFLGGHLSETEPSVPDAFGFRKLVIVATENGRLIALDTGRLGRVVWNTNLIDLPPEQKWEVLSIDSENDTILIRGQEEEFWRVQSFNGTVIQHQPGRMSHGSNLTVSVLDALGEKLVITVKDDGYLVDHPKSNTREGTIIVTRGIQGVVRGWSITPDTDPVIAWEFWPAPGEVIAKVVIRPGHDPVASIGKALGDRNVLYKFINPNIVLIITANPEASTVTVSLLDSASGNTLHTAKHSNIDTTHPIEAIASENWVAYSLFGEAADPFQQSIEGGHPKPRGFQLIVSELYKSEYPNERGPVDSISNFSSIYPNRISSGISIHSPYVISQAYSIPGPISHISTTSTLQGITPRSLLCFLPFLNALISIPRSALDPRRPVGRDPSPTELEEGLFRYNPLLEFDPKWVISHKREILSVRGIVTSPSLLESTSLVFSYGKIDIFGTRVTPIGGFDILGKGFSKLQLVGTVIALAIGTGVVAPMVSFP